jgi:hypothetical protein
MKRLALAGTLWLVACSSGGPTLQQFEGTWAYASGANLSYHCTSTPAQSFGLDDGGLVIREDLGTLIGTRALNMQQPCTETLEVKGNMATAQDAGPCAITGFLATPIQVTLTTDTLTLSADQNSLLEQGVGSAVVVGVTCPATIAGTLVKQ